MMEWSLIKIALSALLVVAAALDLKTRRVPHWITWPLLLVASVLRAWEGAWIVPVYLVALVLVERAPEGWQLPAVLLLVGVGQIAAQFLPGSDAARLVIPWWTVAYGLWMVNVLGGADARLFMALVAFYPNPGLVASLWGGFLVVGVIWLAVVYRRHAWFALLSAWRGIEDRRFPSAEDLKERGRPTTPGLVLGATVYLWAVLLVRP